MRLACNCIRLEARSVADSIRTVLAKGIKGIGWSVALAIAFLSVTCSAASAQSYAFGAGAFTVPQGPTSVVSGISIVMGRSI